MGVDKLKDRKINNDPLSNCKPEDFGSYAYCSLLGFVYICIGYFFVFFTLCLWLHTRYTYWTQAYNSATNIYDISGRLGQNTTKSEKKQRLVNNE
jgi:hypothetical protein